MVKIANPEFEPSPMLERWIWIELIGFDNTRDDFAVGQFLETTGFVPGVASLLVSNPDFIHTHRGLAPERVFPPDFCSYSANPRNEERERQAWTPLQLHGLVQALQNHGIKVYFSVFDTFISQEWIGKHPEILHVRRNGEAMSSLCPWKRLADGGLYEDFFLVQLLQVMADYGFDGFHCADGYAHQRIPISEGDFSDDMVAQCAAASGLALPAELQGSCDGLPSRLEERATWIWRHRRREWIHFYVNRTAAFVRKLTVALHAAGRRIMMNTAWTKDPFEAMYRYGVDYRLMADAGIDAFIAETAAGASELAGYEFVSGRRALHPFMAALLLLRACTRNVPLICLNGIKDNTEQWSVMRHAPPLLEAECYAMGSLFIQAAAAAPRRCAAGMMACLADAIRPEEWRRVRDWWHRAWEFQPASLPGVTLVWSDAALDRQLDEYVQTRRWTMHRLLHHLIELNAPIAAIARIEDLAGVRGPILVLNPQLFPEPELALVQAYRQGPKILIGGDAILSEPPVWRLADLYSPAALVGAIYGAGPLPLPGLEPDETEELPADLPNVPEPSGPHALFYHDLYFRKVSKGFLRACAGAIAACANGVRIVDPPERARVTTMAGADGRLRLVIGNDRHDYNYVEVEVGRPVGQLHLFPPLHDPPPAPAESRFRIWVPPRGAVMVEVP